MLQSADRPPICRIHNQNLAIQASDDLLGNLQIQSRDDCRDPRELSHAGQLAFDSTGQRCTNRSELQQSGNNLANQGPYYTVTRNRAAVTQQQQPKRSFSQLGGIGLKQQLAGVIEGVQRGDAQRPVQADRQQFTIVPHSVVPVSGSKTAVGSAGLAVQSSYNYIGLTD